MYEKKQTAVNPLHTIFIFCRFSGRANQKKQPIESCWPHWTWKGSDKPIIMRIFVASKENEKPTISINTNYLTQ